MGAPNKYCTPLIFVRGVVDDDCGAVMSESLSSVFYLGDSHVRYLKKAARMGLLAPHAVSGVEVGGATAVGMRNPNAKTNAIGKFRARVSRQPRESVVVMHLGEVDCGFVIWHRAEKYGEPIDAQMASSLDAYFEFVDELLNLGFRKIIITGATLPTITDEDQSGDVVLKRSSVRVSQLERTNLTLRYNEQLNARATERELPYVDISADVIDPATGVVRSRMRNRNPEDHHMDGRLAAAYWARRLQGPISQLNPSPSFKVAWRCVRETYLKGHPGHSRNIPSDMLQKVCIGDVLTGSLIEMGEEYAVIADARSGDSDFGFIALAHVNHFRVER